jgi:hypothetical protein
LSDVWGSGTITSSDACVEDVCEELEVELRIPVPVSQVPEGFVLA